ncbi:uncharacterized protein LOC100246496 isoform X1 [Vitis vinifera]|uniref:uncharacterized protein LOC100246496 isoform X1 n=1 Tax=Vitis vinifera TaxID=29760 RepID=UPI00053F96B9|nr:uncharacterized protein LOC100246496 isoform X1 [Vitis vinifera]|eukprot:XP_010661725.1 PREDICTED: methionine adenosyltransferase 2 subunit beta isoform X1 [Vitis vinifera]
MSKKRVLVVGGTGYLGQHLLQGFSEIQGHPFDLAFTHHSTPPQPLVHAIPHSRAFHVNLQSGEGFEAISRSFGQPHVVVNCAAISVPRSCEMDPAAAMSINVPSSLVKWLLSFEESNTLLIHLSTDQVYEGVKSFYKEEDETVPVNVYGKSKVAAEQFISTNFSNYAILRSSIIIGPQAISPVPKSLPIQWIDGVLSRGDKMDFFYDEFRCPVYVKDVVAIILALTTGWIAEGKQMKLILNAGGPDRVSRAQIAETVADVRGYDTSLIKPVSASSNGLLGSSANPGHLTARSFSWMSITLDAGFDKFQLICFLLFHIWLTVALSPQLTYPWI